MASECRASWSAGVASLRQFREASSTGKRSATVRCSSAGLLLGGLGLELDLRPISDRLAVVFRVHDGCRGDRVSIHAPPSSASSSSRYELASSEPVRGSGGGPSCTALRASVLLGVPCDLVLGLRCRRNWNLAPYPGLCAVLRSCVSHVLSRAFSGRCPSSSSRVGVLAPFQAVGPGHSQLDRSVVATLGAVRRSTVALTPRARRGVSRLGNAVRRPLARP